MKLSILLIRLIRPFLLSAVVFCAFAYGTEAEWRVPLSSLSSFAAPVAGIPDLSDPHSARGQQLPVPDRCRSDCVELAILGGKFMVLGRDEGGVPFVAVAAEWDDEQAWEPVDSDVVESGRFSVLDEWFLSNVEHLGCTSSRAGVVAIGGKLVFFSVSDDGELAVDLAQHQPSLPHHPGAEKANKGDRSSPPDR